MAAVLETLENKAAELVPLANSIEVKDEIYHRFDYVMVFKLDETGNQPGIAKHCVLAMLSAGKKIFRLAC
jgi:hypothetical protein